MLESTSVVDPVDAIDQCRPGFVSTMHDDAAASALGHTGDTGDESVRSSSSRS